MSDEVDKAVDTLKILARLLHLIIVLRPKQLQRATYGYANQGTLGRVWVAWATSMYEGAFVLVGVPVLGGRPVQDIVRLLLW